MNDWMAAASFGRAYEIVNAINILSIHAKLTQAELDDSQSTDSIEGARSILDAFINDLNALLIDTEGSQDGLIIGSDPRMNELAQSFISERKSFPPSFEIFRVPLTQFRELIYSKKPEDLPLLISFLRDLRSIIEQHSHSDIVDILGEF